MRLGLEVHVDCDALFNGQINDFGRHREVLKAHAGPVEQGDLMIRRAARIGPIDDCAKLGNIRVLDKPFSNGMLRSRTGRPHR